VLLLLLVVVVAICWEFLYPASIVRNAFEGISAPAHTLSLSLSEGQPTFCFPEAPRYHHRPLAGLWAEFVAEDEIERIPRPSSQTRRTCAIRAVEEEKRRRRSGPDQVGREMRAALHTGTTFHYTVSLSPSFASALFTTISRSITALLQ